MCKEKKMEEKYSPLFEPWKVGNVEIRNRFVMCPMEGTNLIKWEAATCYNPDAEEFYRERAKAGMGLFIPGAIPQISIVGGKWLYKHPEVFKPVRPLMNELHTYGSKIFFQLTAGPGRCLPMPSMLFPFVNNKFLKTVTKPFLPMQWWNVTPDAGEPNVWAAGKIKCYEFTKDQIHKMVYALGQSSKLCQDAGVDGVEIHAVHEGYLLDQFAMPYTNHRTDEYGGSFENRYRFACEVVQEIKKVCGKDYPVSLRYSVVSKTKGFNKGALPGEEYEEVGRTMEESEKAIKLLRDAGYDMFNCDNGTYDAWYWAHPPVYAPLNMNLEEVAHIKKFTDAPVVCAGRMQPDAAAEAIRNGEIDAMGIGRQFLCDGEYIQKIEEERMEDIRPCISCHASCLPIGWTNGDGADFDLMHIEMGKYALNPYTFREGKFKVKQTSSPKTIAVIGGGIAGMEVAIQASARGHKVELYEESDTLCGVFNAAAAPDFKEKDKELISFYKRQLEKSAATVHLNMEIKSLSDINADEIVIATGSKPRTLKVPGGELAVSATDYLLGRKSVGDKVVVVGGGLTGCEIAYELALKGKHPVIVEMMEYLIKARGVCMANTSMLRDLIAYHKIPVYLESGVKEIRKDSVVVSTKNGDKTIQADSVITSIGYIPGTPLAEKSSEHVHIIGDADKVGNLKSVIMAANELVLKFN